MDTNWGGAKTIWPDSRSFAVSPPGLRRAILRRADFTDQLRCGATGFKGQNLHPNTEAFQENLFRGIEGAGFVIAAFDIHVGPNDGEELAGVRFAKNHDGIDTFQRGEHGGPVALRSEGAGWSFEPAHGLITVQADNQQVAEAAGALERA